MDDKMDDREGCPFHADASAGVAKELDPFGPTYLADPFAVFERARREGRVFYSEELGQWLVTRYEDIRRVALDDAWKGFEVHRHRIASSAPILRGPRAFSKSGIAFASRTHANTKSYGC